MYSLIYKPHYHNKWQEPLLFLKGLPNERTMTCCKHNLPMETTLHTIVPNAFQPLERGSAQLTLKKWRLSKKLDKWASNHYNMLFLRGFFNPPEELFIFSICMFVSIILNYWPHDDAQKKISKFIKNINRHLNTKKKTFCTFHREQTYCRTLDRSNFNLENWNRYV